MAGWHGLRRIFRMAVFRRDARRELDEELAFHFERTVDALRATGLTEGAARVEVRRRFGDERRYRRDLEAIDRGRIARMRWIELGTVVVGQVAYSARAMRRAPTFAVGVVLTLALGIGANSTMFGVVDRILLSAPPGVDDPDGVRRLYVNRVSTRTGETQGGSTITYPDYRDFLAASTLSEVAAYATSGLVRGQGPEAERLSSTWVTASFARALGVRPVLGRFFTEEEDRIGAAGVALLGHGYWQSRYGGDPDVLGSTLDLQGTTYTVIGVTPPGFHGIDLSRVDVWLPLHPAGAAHFGDEWADSRGWYWVATVGRLRDGVSVEAMEAELTALHLAGREEFMAQGRYATDAWVSSGHVIAARGPEAPDEALVSGLLAGVAAIVLLIACANVANLLLARSMQRRREIAVRLSLGISRTRLVAQLVVESLSLALLGGMAALAVAYWGSALMRTVLLPNVAWDGGPLDVRLALFTTAIAGITGLAAGAVPALQSSRPDLVAWLRAGSQPGVARRSKTRVGLLVLQGALSAVLLVGAGLFVKSLWTVRGVDLGYRFDGLVLARLELTPGERELDELFAVYHEAADAVRGVPGVTTVSVSTTVPFRNSWSGSFAVPGRDSLPKPNSGGPYGHGVSPEFLETLGIRLLRGRDFTEADRLGAPQVAIVNESLARGVWPDEDPLGQCVLVGDPDRERPCTTVVGIVADSHRQRVVESEQWLYYILNAQRIVDQEPAGIFVRSTRDPEEVVADMRGRVLAVPQVSFAVVSPFEELLDPQLRAWRLGALMFAVFGALALLVAAVGLYSVLSYNVAQRKPEMGIRAALGATRPNLVGLVFREAVTLTAAGVVVGLALALPLMGRFSNVLYEVSPTDPAVFGIVALGLLSVGALAGALPAWRAAHVDPGRALRVE